MKVIGITGNFGSGCTFIAKNFLEKRSFKYISLSNILRDHYKAKTGSPTDPTRIQLQDFGDELRRENGSDYLAALAYDIIKKDDQDYIVDSIRNPAEIHYIKQNISEFYLLGINADYEIRWNRIKKIYNDNQGAFNKDEKRDKDGQEDFGQQVEKCFERADYVIYNNKTAERGSGQYNILDEQIERFLNLVNRDKLFPTQMETSMAMAQAASLRSSCLKRQVGAVIVDKYSGVMASGYNEVPPENEPCQQAFGGCYRSKLRSEFRDGVNTIVKEPESTDAVCALYRKNVKLMDYCRALHAEENAILSMIRNGNSAAFNEATLYTTTFPCNLCANKIVSVGIKKIVYASPYPMKEAKDVLNMGGVKIDAFSGITYRGYFKMEGLKT